jgi:hypothetical protein
MKSTHTNVTMYEYSHKRNNVSLCNKQVFIAQYIGAFNSTTTIENRLITPVDFQPYSYFDINEIGECLPRLYSYP